VTKLIKIRQLSFVEIMLLARVALLLTTVSVTLRILPFRVIARMVSTLGTYRTRRTKTSQQSIEKVVWAVSLLSRYIPGATCLTQALTTMVLLGRRGYPASLRFAVAKDERGKLQAHAWVENERQVIIGDLKDLSRFVVLSPSKEITL